MAIYVVGDIQGCDAALGRLLAKIEFSASRDTLYVLGDMVNRGPDSLGTLRRLMALGHSAPCVLGNHDLHLLAVAQGVRPHGRRDTLTQVLTAPDAPALLNWLRQQNMALSAHGILMVHAGVLPQWTATQTMALAAEVETVLRGPDWTDFIAHMYGSQPDRWQGNLNGHDRLRVIVNGLTRLRFCTPEGAMEFVHHGDVSNAPPGYLPWFDVPDRQTRHTTVAFGHWSSLSALKRDDVIELDTGCVWGRCLSALHIDPVSGAREKIQVSCSEAA